MTREEYKKYQEKISHFFSDGTANMTPEQDGNTWFSGMHCDVCGTHKGGDRVECTSYNPTTKETYEIAACQDCVYYCTYGQLDDMTMMDMEEEK